MSHVLIVDDKPENLYLLRVLLQGHGYQVEEARDGAQALQRARQQLPALIVSDLLMPVMDGYTLLRQCKADPTLCSVPFVVYTATYTEPRDERLALDLGADAFIVKPAEPGDFMARVEAVLDAATRNGATSAAARADLPPALLQAHIDAIGHKLEDKLAALEAANRELRERNRELQQRDDEWKRFEAAMVDRELRMVELKREVDDLRARLGEPARYGAGAPSTASGRDAARLGSSDRLVGSGGPQHADPRDGGADS